MGIKGLARRLEPYSTRYSPEELDGYTAIIDGPGLAYEAHKFALGTTANQLRIPSYHDINNAALSWLNALEDQGIKVSTILFDGALPESKQAERLSRTEQNNRRVQQLRASYATTACPIPTYLGSASYAFLAPSLREALADSPFASRTRIVPGEADDSCALFAKDVPRSIIFTSDTDLLLFDYPPETLIVLFQDDELPTGLKAHSPYEITKKLQLKSLVPFAYAIQERSSEVQDDLVSDARNMNMDSESFMDFSRRYVAAVVAPIYLGQYSGLDTPLQALDVRIFEFIHRALIKAPTLSVYLPLLVEDPNQASAWNIARDVRILSYSLLTPPASTVQEYRRKAQGISPQEISTYSANSIQVPVKELELRIGALMKWAESRNMSQPLLWSLIALSMILAELNTPPSVPLMIRVLNGEFDNSWAFVQLTARLHAAIYSLRMLKQTIDVWLAINSDTTSTLHGSISGLQKHMAAFPSIADPFIVPGQSKRVLMTTEALRELVEEIYMSVGVEVPTEQVSNKKKKRQAREAERKKKKTDQRLQGTSKGTNTFDLLNDAALG
ncbi:hypothetical protein CC86DRAFT_444823 [Ophiobolus disseminans]|uniref:Asteroid domain-containing protein n=1 Tax=Ophiobolus disseminans TaxID=1469910 RepID=A0A6A7A7X6_9PLEO|nr:hypothetical protein CC86DRAFT_444823 [Ophiobolus disseminans]